MKRKRAPEEEIAEDYCFVCKDGGHLMVCDFKWVLDFGLLLPLISFSL